MFLSFIEVDGMTYEFIVPNMTCGHCVKVITDAIHKVSPNARISADPATHWLTVENAEDGQSTMMAIQGAGYSPRWV